MKEESALYLEKARWHLANAGRLPPPISRKWPPERPITQLSRSRMLYFEQTGNAAKTHKGVHGEFSRWLRTIRKFRKTSCRSSVRPTDTNLFPATRSGRLPGFMPPTLSI